ncbi:MAG: hypothetical protein OSB62_03980 [Alphaproteobacteria bacterium]|nr:hypothetical protein [Alphaproteobacteria bacterium]
MAKTNNGAIIATIEGHCTYVEERPKNFGEHFKAALKGFLEITPKGAQLIGKNIGVVGESVHKWASGEATPHYDMAKDASVFMRHHIAR